jgi:membrane associated rhomboid family serine protease
VFIPIGDRNRRSWIRYHYVTLGLVSGCVAVFLLQISGGMEGFARSIYGFGMIPSVLFGGRVLPPSLPQAPAWTTPLTYMFLHGGVLHLAGNMLFLWVFGDNVEDSMGHRRFLVFFLVCGTVAALAQALVDPSSDIPMVGASGAVSGVLGAYLVLHPRVQVWVLLFAWIPMRLPTWLVLGSWICLQIAYSLFGGENTANIAWWAHIAGFAAGAALICRFRMPHVMLWDTSETGTIDVSGVRLRGRRGPWGDRTD